MGLSLALEKDKHRTAVGVQESGRVSECSFAVLHTPERVMQPGRKSLARISGESSTFTAA